MSSGFNHLNLILGDDFTLEAPYDVTEQVNREIFNNNKVIYCNIVFPKAFDVIGASELLCVMSLLGNNMYLWSIVGPAGDGIQFISACLSNLPDGVYFQFASSLISS